MQVRLESLYDRLAVRHLLPLGDDVVLQGVVLALELLDVHLKLRVLLVVVFEIRIHGLDLLLHLGNLVVLGINLRFQLPDLVIQHELELLKLLILLLQLIDLPLLVADGGVPLTYLLRIVVSLLVQLLYLLVLLPCFLQVLEELVFLQEHLA